MATSGQITDTLSFGYVRLSWTRTAVSTINNTSTIAYELEIYRSGNISSSSSKDYSIVFNGTTVATGTTTVGGSGSKTIKTGTVVIPHNSNGEKTFNYSFYLELGISWSGSSISSASASGSSTLDSIARASIHTLNVSSQFLGSDIVISTNRASSSYTHVITYKLGSASGTIRDDVANSATWTLPNTLAHQMPNSTSLSGTIKCVTYNGSSKVGEHTVNFTAKVPDNSTFNPDFSSISHSEYNSANTSGAYVQSVTRLSLGIVSPVAKYSATIESYRIYIDGQTIMRQTGVTAPISTSGTMNLTARVTDSRGRTESKTITVNVLAYNPPTVSFFRTLRANSDGSVNEVGESVKVTHTAQVKSLLVGGVEKNKLYYTIQSKERTATAWTTKLPETLLSGSINLSGETVLSAYEIIKSYDFRILVRDNFNTSIVLGVVSSGAVTMSWGRSGIGVGKVWEQGGLDVKGGIFDDGKVVPHIVESATNSNGRYIKYSDGTLICWARKVETNIAIDTAYGSLYHGTYTWVYPATFNTIPIVTCSLFRWGNTAGWGSVAESPTVTSAVLRGTDVISRASGTEVNISAMAIGRWKA